jgi:hypothetical protein
MESQKIKVKRHICLCGKTRMISVIDPRGSEFTPEQIEEHEQLEKAGCEVEVITLEEARAAEFCFDCDIE